MDGLNGAKFRVNSISEPDADGNFTVEGARRLQNILVKMVVL